MQRASIEKRDSKTVSLYASSPDEVGTPLSDFAFQVQSIKYKLIATFFSRAQCCVERAIFGAPNRREIGEVRPLVTCFD